MKNLQTTIKKSLIVSVAVVQISIISAFGFTPLVLAASETPASTPEAGVTYAPCPKVNGTNVPTGSAAHTYTLNPATCKYENAYYTWDPGTKQYSALYDQTPTLNAAGTAWEHNEWNYSPAEGKYKKRVISVAVPVSQQPSSAQSPATNSAASTSAGTPGSNGTNSAAGTTVGNTGPGSNNAVNGNTTTNGNLDYTNNTDVITSLDSNATSGNAYVLQNTNGGSATSGDAVAVANFLNMIQSAWNPSSGTINTFNAGIYGNFNGDLLFNPDTIMKTGADSNNTINNNTDTNLTVNATESARIQNDINLNATSGDATVSKNTNAGDATTGDARAVANVINLINSNINTDGAFIGNLNIYGDLTGDILLPASILSQLRNTGFNSNNAIANNSSTDIDADINKNSSITNNLDLNATSGNAVVDSNTSAGNATSGNATTNALQKNIIGGSATGSKGLMVFVNVLGSWVGMMFNGPSDINTTGANSNNTITNNNSTNIDADIDQDYEIVNNINLNSQSGDATVSKNTQAGNATSGDASSSVNLLNVIDGDYDFTDWFGVLFINVFGTWNGSFGTNTSAGNKPTPNNGGSSVKNPGSGAAASNSGATANVAGASSNNSGTNNRSVASSVTSNFRSLVNGVSTNGGSDDTTPATSSATTTSSSGEVKSNEAVKNAATLNGGDNGGISIWIPIAGAILTALAIGSKQILLFGRGLINK